MKTLPTIVLFLILSSCWGGDSFNKKYFKDVSGIQMPEHYSVIEAYDNAEFVTGITLRVDKKTLVDFLRVNNFKIAKNDFSFPRLTGEGYLKKDKPSERNKKGVQFLNGNKGKNSWLYIADTTNNLLWAEIRYTDWSGN